MTGNQVPRHAKVLRYAGIMKWNDQLRENNWRAFVPRIKGDGSIESGLSMYWHEIFPGSLEEQLEQVRLRARLKFGELGHLLEIPVGVATALFESDLDSVVCALLEFIRDPLPPAMGHHPDGTYGQLLADDSHCLLNGVQLLDEQLRTAVAQSLVCAVTREYPTRKPAGRV